MLRITHYNVCTSAGESRLDIEIAVILVMRGVMCVMDIIIENFPI
jgi:hypothetical protein